MEKVTPNLLLKPPAQTDSASVVKKHEAEKVAREFEAVFLTQAVDEMMKTVNMGSFGGGAGEEQWKSFLSREFANEIARSGTIGIAQSVESMLKAYET